MTNYEMIKAVISIISFLYSVGITIITICRSIKNKDWAQMKILLKEELIPLMEQAEGTFDTAEEKENWVIKKLGDKLHIDFFKYKNILNLAKTIIAEICTNTKINVNKIKIVNEVAKTDEGVDNGIY